ncbi:MAG TPA: glycosyltransferase [Opitutales bacterium]|nr:glycosyltransferase [Opitutales bacterium]
MRHKRPVVAFVPREVFSLTEKCLRTLYERTHEPFDLVCVDGNSDLKTAAFLKNFSKEKGFALIRTDTYLSPNQARNLAFNWAKENTESEYIVYVDNDALVAEGWLQALVDCAEETGAALVGPAYYEYLPEESQLHMFGGQCGLECNDSGQTVYYERHDCQHLPVDDLQEPLMRKKTGLIEFHTLLVRMDFLREIGGHDEGLPCQAEHGDISMLAVKHGYEIWVEPASRVTYAPPKRLERADRDFFFLRWSEDRIEENHRHFAGKWGLGHEDLDEVSLRWLREHRWHGCRSVRRVRKVFGRKIAKFYEKKIFRRLEPKWNRYKYASLKWK